jgi:hypothetical protein
MMGMPGGRLLSMVVRITAFMHSRRGLNRHGGGLSQRHIVTVPAQIQEKKIRSNSLEFVAKLQTLIYIVLHLLSDI